MDIKPFLAALREGSDYDFSNYSESSLQRRIIKILNDFRIEYDELVEKIRNDESFREKVVKKITVNTTDFFRDADLWIYLREYIFPLYSSGKKISIWHPGCSTGQEVYSMLILLNEMKLLGKADIFASDLNTDVLDIARKGDYKLLFNEDYVTNFDKVINDKDTFRKVLPEKYFHYDPGGDQIIMENFLREKPVYKKMDLVKDKNPFGRKFDIIMCRNVIIYFNTDLQNRVIDLFQENLYEKGCLVLGMHENLIGDNAARFIRKEKVYIKK